MTDGARSRSRVFDRYAAVLEGVTTDDAQPVSILLDPSPGDVLDDEAGITHFALDEDVNYFDLCSDVAPGSGTFFIEIDDQRIECCVQFDEMTSKYRIESEALNARFPPPEHDNRKQGRSLVQRLNQRQAFRILTSREGVVYSEGSFYEPKLSWALEDGSKPILDYIFAAKTLNPVVSEKGEDYFSKNIGEWYRQSIFGIFAATCEGKRTQNGIDADDLTAEIEAVPIWLCDDDSKEIGDFIGIDPDDKKMILVHAKVGAQEEGGQGFNVGGLQEVGRQALACLSFISHGRPSEFWTPDRWQKNVQANKKSLVGRSRIFRNKEGEITAGDVFGTRASMKNNYLYRWLATMGIWGNSKQEAMYPIYWADASGQKLNGANRYTLHFPKGQLPPAHAFWSLTMYQLPESLLVANPIDRYLINSPMLPDMKMDAEGGLTLYIQHESPGKDLESNWLPAPKGPFAAYLRIYWPEAAALDGTWTAPKLEMVK